MIEFQEGFVPFCHYFEVNPVLDLLLSDDSPCSFVPMDRVSNSGELLDHGTTLFSNRQGFTVFKEHDTLFAKITPSMENGKGAYAHNLVNEVGVGTTEFYVLRAKENVHPRFVYHVSISADFRSFARNMMTGTAGQQRVQQLAFERYMIPNLSYSEQVAISRILDDILRTISVIRKLVGKLEMIREGMLDDLLTLGIKEDGQLRDRETDEFQDTEIGLLPASWGVTGPEEFDIQAGFALGPERAPMHNAVPYVTVAHVKRDYLDLSDERYMEVNEVELAERSICAGDILMIEAHANINEIGRCSMATDEVAGWTFQNHIYRLRPTTMDSYFALITLNSNYARKHWRTVATTTSGMNTINRSKVKQLRLPSPPPDEQTRINDAMESIRLRIHVTRNELLKYVMIKSGLQNDLLTGERPIPVELLGPTEAVA
jgi:type I restriction enzyme S subunit